MAAIERGEGAPDAVVKGWLARALSAPRGPQWVCDKCHHIHAEWVPACENCHSFDTLSWTAPPNTMMTTPTGLEMLPLIVGALDDQEPETPEEDDTVLDAEIVEEGEEEKPGK
jgi:HemY protein